jgi:hypothetical protein
VPPLEDAAMICSKELFEALLAKGDIVTSASTPSSTPMHYLSGKCTVQFARYLSTMYDPLGLDASGRSPFELFFERWLFLNEEAEKYHTILLNSELLRLLLPDDFVFVRDTESVHAWEIICRCICQAEVCCLIPKDNNGGASGDTKNDCEYYLADDISTIFRCGILSSYENSQGVPGILPLIKSVRRHRLAHFCESSFTSLIREVLRVSSIKASFCDCEDYYGLFIRVICANFTRLLQVLTDQGVDLLGRVPESVCKTPKSLFEIACERAELGLFQLLLAHIPLERLHVLGPSGRTPVELLVYGRSPDKALLLEALSENGPVSMPENLECPLIVKAASDSEWNLVKGLARLGHDVSIKSSGGWGLAQYAVSQGDLDMFKWVMESVSETAQWQTLSLGSSESHPNRVRKQTIFDTQLSLLHMGGLQPHVLAYMLENKLFSDVNITTYNGRTPLHWAAFCGVETGCQMLIAQGADPSIRDKSGKLAIDYAHFHDYEEVVAMLLEAGSPQPEELFTDDKQMDKITSATELEMRRRVKFENAIWDGDLAECEQAFLTGCSVDRPVPSCLCSPLFLAIRARQDHITARLLDQGASTLDNKCHHNVQKNLVAHAADNIDSAALMRSILAASFKQQTIWHTGLNMALHIAVEREEPELVKVILEHFNLHIKDFQ